MYFNLVKIFMPTAVAFFLGLFFTPFATHFFYKYKMWKKYSRSIGATNSDFQKINNEKEELKTPRVGGIIIWISVLTTVLIFFYKLGLTSIHIPFGGDINLDILIIPFFIIVALATFSGGVIDGIDGLSGGVLASIFGAYSAIAYVNHQMDIAAFAGVITGAILAFLWFNIPPARFYMGETGIMGLTLTLATLAFLTDTVLILPVVALPLVLTSLSVILQIASKKLRGGKRLFRLAPLHHHFEAIGWSPYKVTMRFWIFSTLFAIIGIILAVISR